MQTKAAISPFKTAHTNTHTTEYRSLTLIRQPFPEGGDQQLTTQLILPIGSVSSTVLGSITLLCPPEVLGVTDSTCYKS
jgi:hypothetical protein